MLLHYLYSFTTFSAVQFLRKYKGGRFLRYGGYVALMSDTIMPNECLFVCLSVTEVTH